MACTGEGYATYTQQLASALLLISLPSSQPTPLPFPPQLTVLLVLDVELYVVIGLCEAGLVVHVFTAAVGDGLSLEQFGDDALHTRALHLALQLVQQLEGLGGELAICHSTG